MDSSDPLDKLPVIREIAGPSPIDGIGRALRRTFPATTDVSIDFGRLLAALDLIPTVCPRGLALRPRP